MAGDKQNNKPIAALLLSILQRDEFNNNNATLNLFPSATSKYNYSESVFQNTDASSPLVSDDVMQYVYTVVYSIVCAACCLFGIVTNVTNIVVFISMKFKETVNIALLGLAVSDLCSVTSLLWLCICFNPLFMYSDVPIHTFEVQHKTGGWTHVVFTRVTAFITVYITLERCLCIVFPLKIKTFLTPKRVGLIIAAIYVVIIGSLSQNYANFRLGWKFVPSLNRTMLGMVYTENRYIIQTVTYILNVLYVIVSFVSVVVCSTILIWKLTERGRWLYSVSADKDRSKTARDKQVIKMVVVVAVIFIISFTPSVMFFLMIAIEPELNMGKRYQNLFMIISSVSYIFDAINSSVNIFVYYNMNSKFASTFRSLCCPKLKLWLF